MKRNFLILFFAIICCCISFDLLTAEASEPEVFVDYEYGDLKEVIVGLPYGMSPSLSAPWFENAMKVLPSDEAEYARKTAGMLWTDMIDPKTGKSETEKLENENLALINILRSLGVKVLRPKEITVDFIKKNYGSDVLVNGFSQDFPRDNLAIIGNNLIELNLRTPLRKVDISGFKELLIDKGTKGNVRWFSMPHTELLAQPGPDTPLLEGGDVIVLGKTILVGNTQNPSVGSNEAGYKWLKNVLGGDYHVVRVPLNASVLHLDCVLSVPRKGLAIVCKEAFVDGMPDPIKGWDLIKVNMEDVQRLAVNGIPVDAANYIMSFNQHNDNRHLQSELEKRGIKVYRVFFGTHNGQGGSLRCATQPLVRKVR